MDKMRPAKDHLIETFDYMNQVLIQDRFLLRQDAVKIIRSGDIGPSDSGNDRTRLEMRDALLQDVRKRCNLYSLVANLFYAVGHQKNCEKAYVKYV